MEKVANKTVTKKADIFLMPRGHSLRLIEAAFKDPSGCLMIDYIETPITCPYTLKRLVHPCRTFGCKHIQCFDASSVPDFSDGVNKIYTLGPRWKCPICGKAVNSLSQVYEDAYFVEILEKSETDANIQIFPDGTWATLKDVYDEEKICGSPIVINDSIIDLTNDSLLDRTIIDLTELDITVDDGVAS